MICSFKDCPNERIGLAALCSGHRWQRYRGLELTPIKLRRKWSEDDRRRVNSWLGLGRTWAWVGRQLGMTGKAVKDGISRRPRSPAPHEPRPPMPALFRSTREDLSDGLPRCRCGLRLPCNGCLPTTAAAWAQARVDNGESAIVLRSKAA